MNFSASNTTLWNAVIQFGTIGLVTLLSNVLRRKLPLVRKSLMPVSVLAGFVLLFMRIGGLIRIDSKLFETVMYHAIAIGFITLALQTVPENEKIKSADFVAARSGALIVATYLLQGVLGLAITIGLAYTIKPDMFKAAGILLPMGYGQGSGQANNVGSTYQALGFAGGQSFGLSIAAIGYVASCIVGIIYLNQLKNRKIKSGIQWHKQEEVLQVEHFESTDEPSATDSIDRFSTQVFLVMSVYLVTYLVTLGLDRLITATLPGFAKMVVPILWGFNFVIGTLIGQATRGMFNTLRKKGIMTHQYVNNYLMGRISGFAFDLMVIAGIATIDINDLSGLWLPFWLMAVLGAIITLIFVQWLCKYLYRDYYDEGLLSMYGMLVGNISSGMMLLREIDPDFRSPAAGNLVSGTSFAILLGVPLLVLIGLAPQSDLMAFVTLGLLLIYMVPLVLFIIKGKRKTAVSDQQKKA